MPWDEKLPGFIGPGQAPNIFLSWANTGRFPREELFKRLLSAVDQVEMAADIRIRHLAVHAGGDEPFRIVEGQDIFRVHGAFHDFQVAGVRTIIRYGGTSENHQDTGRRQQNTPHYVYRSISHL